MSRHTRSSHEREFQRPTGRGDRGLRRGRRIATQSGRDAGQFASLSRVFEPQMARNVTNHATSVMCQDNHHPVARICSNGLRAQKRLRPLCTRRNPFDPGRHPTDNTVCSREADFVGLQGKVILSTGAPFIATPEARRESPAVPESAPVVVATSESIVDSLLAADPKARAVAPSTPGPCRRSRAISPTGGRGAGEGSADHPEP
jgi:hypothetical protein